VDEMRVRDREKNGVDEVVVKEVRGVKGSPNGVDKVFGWRREWSFALLDDDSC
jgi:hypothetical protein